MKPAFDICHSSFDSALALLCVRASNRAYLTATDSEPSTDTQYLILELPDRVIVAFRGTSSLEDFLSDADFFTTHINLNDDSRVHIGFYKAYKSIESRLKARLDEIVTRRAKGYSIGNFPVVFTGHSLGGALAILAAYYLNRFYNIEAVYTFGAPDVGNADFARRYDRQTGSATFALANAGDPVTWLPPYRFGFRRVGKFFFLPGVTWMVPGFQAPPLARAIAGAIQVFQNWRHGKPALLPNHCLTLYKQRVEKLTA